MKICLRSLALFLLLAGIASAQGKIPFIAGGQLETGAGLLPNGKYGAGLVRATPFIGAWLQDLGYAKVGFSYWRAGLVDSSGADHGVQEHDLSLQLGTTFGGQGRPYLIGSFTRARQLSDLGDASWTEWGSGLGTFFEFNAMSALMIEAEFRWIGSHYDPVHDLELSGTRIQINFGYVVYFY